MSEATKDTAERGFERANCYSHPRVTAAKERFLKKPFLDERDRVNENVALSSDASRMECLESVGVDVSHAESLEFVSVDVFHVEGLASAFHKAILWVLLRCYHMRLDSDSNAGADLEVGLNLEAGLSGYRTNAWAAGSWQ